MRYIDPYQLADKVAESMRDNPHEGKIALNHRLEHEHFLRMIALAPDADVEPVIHGRWEDGVCGACGFDIRDMIDGESEFRSWVWECIPYCPNCGAKMDKED